MTEHDLDALLADITALEADDDLDTFPWTDAARWTPPEPAPAPAPRPRPRRRTRAPRTGTVYGRGYVPMPPDDALDRITDPGGLTIDGERYAALLREYGTP
ncbi:hypothetical protein [Mycobacterium servetii]|uniref:Uncharacterized protein n=1 Tax=Mycobacterium servetii TaxID=3237418 RepID=A0ABV4BUE9_9MYCO